MTIGGKRVRVIDIHCHCAIDVTSIVKGTPLEKEGGGGGKSGARVRNDLQLMEQDRCRHPGADHQRFLVVQRRERPRSCRAHRPGLRTRVSQSGSRHTPQRFVAMASVALQHPDLAAQQLEDGVKRLGLRGASIGGHVNGEDLSLPKYDPFWFKAAELGVPVVMHPGGADNIIKDGALRGARPRKHHRQPARDQLLPSRLIFDGTFDNSRTSSVCAAHAGGYLPRTLDARRRPVRSAATPTAPTKKAERYSQESGLRRHDGVLGGGSATSRSRRWASARLSMGPDVPLNWPVTVDLVLHAKSLSDADKIAVLSGNLQKLLRIS